LPIRFIGAGEGMRDLRPFNSFEFIEALLADKWIFKQIFLKKFFYVRN